MDATLYWSRFPGRYVKKETGQPWEEVLPPGVTNPPFKGGPREWYETLVQTISDCIGELQRQTFNKYGRAERVDMHTYVHPDVACILQASVLLKLLPDGATAPDNKSKPVGQIFDFSIWEDPVLPNDVVRVVAVFDVKDGADKTMYGNVRILDMPENGRKA